MDSSGVTPVRRLEALRRQGGLSAREADGSWAVAPDHIERAERFERQRAPTAPPGSTAN